MAKLLEDIWNNYQLEKKPQIDNEEKEIINRLVQNERKFTELLNREQTIAYENFDACINELHTLIEKDAFIKGVRFATKFLIESIYEI